MLTGRGPSPEEQALFAAIARDCSAIANRELQEAEAHLAAAHAAHDQALAALREARRKAGRC